MSETSCVRQVQQFDHGTGETGGGPPVSVAAVAARWIDCLQLLEVELGNGLQLLRQPRRLKAGRQIVEPGTVLVAKVDQRRHRRRPALGPWRGPAHRRRRRRVVLLTPSGTMSRLAFGWGHWHGADERSGHVLTPNGNRDRPSRLPIGSGGRSGGCSVWFFCQFFVRSGKGRSSSRRLRSLPGARARDQGTETLAKLGGLPP